MGQMLASFKAEYNIAEAEKVTYSGRLDPLASGEVLLLTGEDVYKKDGFNKHDKIYKFTVMFGVATDTGDILGLPKKRSLFNKIFRTRIIPLTKNRITSAVKKFIKTFSQRYPAYSSYNINGVPLWQLARDGKLPKHLPKNKVTIYDIQVFDVYEKGSNEILTECQAKIKSVDGDFRQEWVGQGWDEVLNKNSNTDYKNNKEFIFADMRATVSSGTYIRVLCEDIGKKLCTPALAYSIEREEIL